MGEHSRTRDAHRRRVHARGCSGRAHGVGTHTQRHAAVSARRAADRLRSSHSRHRAAHRLPVLPFLRRACGERGHTTVVHMRGLSQHRLDEVQCAQPRATERCHGETTAVESRECAAGFRVLQSRHSCEQGRRMRELSRPHRPDAAGLPVRAIDDELVRRLPSQSRAQSATAVRNHDHGVHSAGTAARARSTADERISCACTHELHNLSPIGATS